MSKKKNLPQYSVAIAKRSGLAESKASAISISRTLLFIVTTEFNVDLSSALKLFRGINDLLDKSERSFPLLITRRSEYVGLADLKPVLPYWVCDSRLRFRTRAVDKESVFINALYEWQKNNTDLSLIKLAKDTFIRLACSLERFDPEDCKPPPADKYHNFTFEYCLDNPSLYYVQKRQRLIKKNYSKAGDIEIPVTENHQSTAISHSRVFDLSKKPFTLYKSATLPK